MSDLSERAICLYYKKAMQLLKYLCNIYIAQFNLKQYQIFAILVCQMNTASFFKKKFPRLFKQESFQGEEQCQQLQAITINDEDSNSMKSLYYMPKHMINNDVKIFNPQDWTIKNFEIGRHIGKGKYGHVYLARQRKTKHIVALKILSKKQILKQGIVNQIHRQLEIHSHIKHQNILQLYGFFFDQKRIYMILEYASGGQLYKTFKDRGRFSQEQTSKFSCQIIKAMKHLHKFNIIHRDLKPQNMLLCDEQTIKLSDFGWSVHTTKSRKTFCGTIDYICPQILHKLPYDSKLDMWTIGILTYELNAGYPPFESPTRQQTVKRIKFLQFDFPQHFSQQLKDFISNLLLINPNDRMNEDQALNHEYIVKHAKHLL